MQGLEKIALQKYEEIISKYPSFSNSKKSDEQRLHERFISTFQKRYDFFYFMILRVSNSPSDMKELLDMTTPEIIDYYLATNV